MVRLVVIAMNLMLRLLKRQVRASTRPEEAVERIAHENGLAPHLEQDVGRAWRVVVFRRVQQVPATPE